MQAFYQGNFLSQHKHLYTFAKLCFRNWNHKLLVQLLETEQFGDIQKKWIISTAFADSKIQEDDKDEKRIPYISLDKATKMIVKYTDPNIESFVSYYEQYREGRIAANLGFLFAREDISAEYINTLAKWFYETEQWESLYLILKSGSIKLDKTKIDVRIQDLITQWKLNLADKISYFAGLNAVRAAEIAREKIKSGAFSAYEIERAIDTHKLDTSYYQYAINACLTRNNLNEALACSEKHNILITAEQLAKYKSK